MTEITLSVYEIISAKKDSTLEFALLTEQGVGDGPKEARIQGLDLELTSQTEKILLKKVSEYILESIRQGTLFYIIDLKKDEVEAVTLVV